MVSKVLIGEDNFVAQQIMEAMLEGKCNDVVIASTYREIIAALQKDTFDLLLLDYHLDKNADFIIPEIRKLSLAHLHLPIYILSAEPEATIRENLKRIDFSDCIPKPISKVNILERSDLVYRQLPDLGIPIIA